MQRLVDLLDPRNPRGARAIHYSLFANLALVVAFILGAVFGVVGTKVVQRLPDNHGSSAFRPGLKLMSGAKPIVPEAVSINAVSRPHSLVTGSGAGFCGQYGGYQLGVSFRNIYACGPSLGNPTPFDTAGFQCVELSARYVSARYGKFVTGVAAGADFVSVAHSEYGFPVGRPGANSVPKAGDVMSLGNNNPANPFGHTAVVTGVHIDRNGNGTIALMEQNASANGRDVVNVNAWNETYGSPNWNAGIDYYTNLSWLMLAKRPHFPVNRWSAYRKAHHRSLIQFVNSRTHKLYRIAQAWELHAKLCRGVVSRQRWVAKKRRHGHGYMRQQFVRCLFYDSAIGLHFTRIYG